MRIEYEERSIDRHFAAFICRQATGEVSELFRLVVSLASSAVGKGSSCLNLADIAGITIVVEKREYILPRMDALRELMMNASVVSLPGGELRPLLLDATGRLYLYRYWHYEQELARILLQKAGARSSANINEPLLIDGLARLFPRSATLEDDRQKEAAIVALQKQFCVISGAPGTGKTSAVVRILALLLEQDGRGKQRIAMAAPTGKAAARLKKSIHDIKNSLDCSDEVKSAIPDDVLTIHRLLGTLAGSTRFRYSANNPLPFDTVIIDEASMIALPLMTLLVSALKPAARLILLGDRDQLASVEAGSVLGDICMAGTESPDSPLSGSLVMFEKNYRFLAGSGIAEISRAVNGGLESQALELLKSKASGISWQELPASEELQSALAKTVVEGYQGYLDAASAPEALERFDRFRILCALREGAYGVSGLNRTVENILAREGLIRPTGTFYRGRPLMITVNNYAMRLFNGDTGILFPDPENGGRLRAFFPSPDGGVRSIAPERLPLHETAFAITIHKSQGSEFDRILMLLPPVDGEILTRELLYTGITRAKESVEIWSHEEIFCATVRKKTTRCSGLHF
jgi:exodeoxyribonuclease V alpha subunit